MTCDDCQRLLGEHLDRTLLATAEASRLETHLASCASCRQLAQELDRLRDATAALPAAIPPLRDLWPAIADRITAEQPTRRAPAHRRHLQLAAAAGLGALLATATTLLLVSRTPVSAPAASDTAVERAGLEVEGANPAPPSSRPGADPSDPAIDRMGLSALAGATVNRVALDRAYGLATDRLAELYARHADRLAPETRAAFDSSLEAIDTALEELRVALAADPQSGPLLRDLERLHRSRLSVLERATVLTSRT